MRSVDAVQPTETVKPKRAAAGAKPLSHNLNGQRLGRKGRDTRARILAATNELLAGPIDTPISLSAVARQASLGMTSLYQYFTDLTELLLALLEPLMTDERLQGNHRLDTARAHLLELAGKLVAAEALYRSAALKTTSMPERNYLLLKAARLRQL